MTLHLRAPAKINLTLDVLGIRPDGYHDLRSVFQTIDLCDDLEFTHLDGSDDTLTVGGPEAAGVPADGSNIVLKALRAVRGAAVIAGAKVPHMHIRLTKHIPSQAGLGGGSSDAAAALVAACQLARLDFSTFELTAIAAKVGADVPFFLHGGLCLVAGIGECVSPIKEAPLDRFVVIVQPDARVETAAAYKALDALGERSAVGATDTWLASTAPTLSECDATMSAAAGVCLSAQRRVLHNDFEPAVFKGWPQVAAAHATFAEIAARARCTEPRLCGSGACLFALAETSSEVDRAAMELRASGLGRVWTAKTAGGGFALAG